MANKNLFASFAGRVAQIADAKNHHFAPAFALRPEAALAQLATTGTLQQTFYADANEQLEVALNMCARVDAKFVAKLAVYARRHGHMKDMPALLLAYLAAYDIDMFDAAFDGVVDNGRMLRTFVQIMRSGVTGRRSFGTRIKRKIRGFLDAASDDALFKMSVGGAPSLADIIKMVHPHPKSAVRAALYGYLIGRDVSEAQLPQLVREFEAFKRDRRRPMPDVPFQLLTALPLEAHHWRTIAENAPWQMTRMNLNTFQRHGVFSNAKTTSLIAKRLANVTKIQNARVFPYQLLAASVMASDVPRSVRSALSTALEISVANVPALKGNVIVAPDVSGSMSAPVTGYRRGGTTAVRCIDVAALLAAAVVRKNERARVLPFEHRVVDVQLAAKDSVMSNAARLASIGGGGTTCSAPLAQLNREKARVDLVIMISDNESWAQTRVGRSTETLREWDLLKRRCPRAKLVCIDVQPYVTVQAPPRADILHIGGFSDAVFNVIARFVDGTSTEGHWVREIESIALNVAA